MDGNKGNESDGDFASAESEQGQEQLAINNNTSSCTGDDVTLTSPSQDDTPPEDKSSGQQDGDDQYDIEIPPETADQHDSQDDHDICTKSQGASEVIESDTTTTDTTAQDNGNINPQSQIISSSEATAESSTTESSTTTETTTESITHITQRTTQPVDSSVDTATTTPTTSGEDSQQTPKQASAGAGGSWGWGSWGSVWSSVTNITESAGKGISSVISTVEESLGIPSPESLDDGKEGKAVNRETDNGSTSHHLPTPQQDTVEDAPKGAEKMIRDEEPVQSSSSNQQGSFWNSLGSIASSVQSTSAGIVAGSLGALETLGKKTMDILSEGDPGFRKKRELLGGKTKTLSELIREAKEEVEARKNGQDDAERPAVVTFSLLFDEYQGVVHLEALELLSSECANKVTSEQDAITDEQKETVKEQFDGLTAAFQLDESPEEDKEEADRMKEMTELLSGLSSFVKVDKLTKAIEEWRRQAVVSEDGDPTIEVLYQRGMRSLAETTSITINLFRKISEVTLLPDATPINLVAKAKDFNRFTVLVSGELESLASLYAQQLVNLNKDDSDSSVTSLYLEASNSSSYINDAFQLLLPVLQYNCVVQCAAS
ncbi:protein FAM114A2-like [Dysidea avara]|uniref:protein FAM114A2-like n=1 Tax=Dysidea avara TaxID=196820 RepID=UPI003318EF37